MNSNEKRLLLVHIYQVQDISFYKSGEPMVFSIA